MVPIFPPWKKSPLSTLRVCRTPGAQREARVAAVCGFPSRLRVCARVCHIAPRCADVRATRENTGAIRQPNAVKPCRGGKTPPVREEPASHLASRRCPGSLPNASNRAEARTHFYERRKDEKRQAIQHPNLGTGFRDNPPKSSTSPYESERLCDGLLSRKTHRDA